MSTWCHSPTDVSDAQFPRDRIGLNGKEFIQQRRIDVAVKLGERLGKTKWACEQCACASVMPQAYMTANGLIFQNHSADRIVLGVGTDGSTGNVGSYELSMTRSTFPNLSGQRLGVRSTVRLVQVAKATVTRLLLRRGAMPIGVGLAGLQAY